MDGQTNVFLVGFMGCGKSTVGKALALAASRRYLDVDEVFADLHGGMTTGQYISRHGLDVFRPEEQAALRSIVDGVHGAVVATGAGVPVYPGNMEMMLANGLTVHLKVPLDAISARMTPSELARRPVWTARTPAELEALYNERLPIYDSAELIIDASRSVEECVAEILRHLAR